MGETLECDALILGGGIAGLWTLARLRRAGYSALLLEAAQLGAGQTIASQGIIHGGVKYALTGSASRASAAIAAMPGIWRRCLGLDNTDGQTGSGEPEVDLREVDVPARSCVLWTGGGLGSRIMGLAASRAIRVGPERLSPDERPQAFAGAPKGIDVYRLGEPVLEPRSLVGTLARAHLDAIGAIDWPDGVELMPGHDGIKGATVEGPSGPVTIRPRLAVAAAGAGNESIARRLGADTSGAPMQRRPLHMVMVRGELPAIFGHCIGSGSRPRATITAGRDAGGQSVWWIGGQLAEDGVERSEEEQLDAARAELASILPWIDFSRARWAGYRVDRAEGLTPDGSRPDEPVVRELGNVMICWPTKLAFAPAVGERVLERVRTEVGDAGALEQPELALDRPGVAPLPWDEEGVTWR